MQRNKSIIVLVLVLLVGVMTWSLIFKLSTGDQRGREVIKSDYTDSLSGEKVSKESINNIQYVNPWAPYFVGFNDLAFFGIPEDDKRYIQDFIINYVLEYSQKKPAIVSLAKDTFKGPFISDEGYKTEYSFNFGIDGDDVHSLKATNNGRDDSITISILKDNAQVAQKKFTIYYLSDSL